MPATAPAASASTVATALLDHLRTTDDLPSPGWFVGYIDTAEALRDEPGGRILFGAVVLLAQCWKHRLGGPEPEPDAYDTAVYALEYLTGEGEPT